MYRNRWLYLTSAWSDYWWLRTSRSNFQNPYPLGVSKAYIEVNVFDIRILISENYYTNSLAAICYLQSIHVGSAILQWTEENKIILRIISQNQKDTLLSPHWALFMSLFCSLAHGPSPRDSVLQQGEGGLLIHLCISSTGVHSTCSPNA